MSFVLQTLSSLWEIVVFGILLGAGLPAVFALGLRALSPRAALAPVSPSGGTVPMEQVGARRKAIAVVCFGVVIAAVATAIVYLIVTGHR